MTKRIIYDRVNNQDQDGKVPTAETYNSTVIYIPFEAEFTERIYKYHYYHYSDIIASIGGLQAFITPFITSFGPFFVIMFLIMLANILTERQESGYIN